MTSWMRSPPDPGQKFNWRPVQLAGLQALLLDDPVERPVRTSFGLMRSRPGLLLRVLDAAGVAGYGEVWCNFPAGGARYRACLASEVVAPLVTGLALDSPDSLLPMLEERVAVLALQCGDVGAIAQVLAGVDQAVWDLFARKLGKPFWKLCDTADRVPVYASGIGPQDVARTIHEQAGEGHSRFKIKLGFGDAVDAENVRAALAALPAGATLLVDVNQGWSFAQASHWIPRLAEAGIAWCEEPLRADAPWEQWRRLCELGGPMRIAAGENHMGLERLLAGAREGGLAVLQPDLGKWGGFTANLALAARLADPAVWICPHWLAGGVGLAASLQFKAAIGGAGWVEMDVNPNPQRTKVFRQRLAVTEGSITLSAEPGIVPALAPEFAEAAHWQSSPSGDRSHRP